jgi:tetratricopeptide (TPR) repeat protein
MNNTDQTAFDQVEPLDARLDTLFHELELAIKWKRPSILFAIYGSEYVQADAASSLENKIFDLGRHVVRVQVDDKDVFDLVACLPKLGDLDEDVFFVKGLRWGRNHNGLNAYQILNEQRNFFRAKSIQIVFWLTEKEAVDLAHHAPEYWTFRHRVVEFVDAPTPEQILQHTLEAVWQDAGIEDDLLEDTDAKISLRESLLVDLPESEESTSMRGRLLLSLGILYWRRGNYDQADEFLNAALDISELMHDRWFKAECCNAIALVKTGWGRLDEAITAYKQALELVPDRIFPWTNLGHLYNKLGRYQEAIEAFKRAIEHNPKDGISWNGLGNAYLQTQALEQALAAYQKSIELSSEYVNSQVGLGNVLFKMQRYGDALSAYQKATEMNQQLATPWVKQGYVHRKLGSHEQAVEAFTKAVEVDSKNARIWNELGNEQYLLGNFNEAIDSYQQAIRIDRHFGWPFSNIALIYFQIDQYDEAIELYRKSLSLFNCNADKVITLNRMGDVYRHLNDYQSAIKVYKQADELNAGHISLADEDSDGEANSDSQAVYHLSEVETPDDAIPADAEAAAEPSIVALGKVSGQEYFMSVESSWAKGDERTQPGPDEQHVSCLRNTQRAIEMNELGNFYFGAGDYDKAILSFSKAIEQDPEYGWSYSNLALVYSCSDRGEEAIPLYRKSIDLLESNKDKAVTWFRLGNVYRQLNDYNGAIASYRRADDLDPDNALALKRSSFDWLNTVPVV